MWNITSDSIQSAKDRIEVRRVEIETKYAEEKQALDAEMAVVESLEHAAAEFMLRQARQNGATAAEPAAAADPADGRGDRDYGGDEPASAQRGDRGETDGGPDTTARYGATEGSPAGAGDGGVGLDILKPGSRWRLYRGINRPADPEGIASDASPPAE